MAGKNDVTKVFRLAELGDDSAGWAGLLLARRALEGLCEAFGEPVPPFLVAGQPGPALKNTRQACIWLLVRKAGLSEGEVAQLFDRPRRSIRRDLDSYEALLRTVEL